ncbi:MAG: NAD(P)-dependent oxidoreductase [Chloroflexi bacterium]|nr:NAD(P)-dependent oxidoreductase [Chloroflexota bacterium]
MNVGFIGLGAMGLPMARNLLRAGHGLSVYDVRREPMEALQPGGAVPCASAGEAAAGAEFVVTMLFDSGDVRQAVLGSGGVAEHIRKGSVLIEMSTVSPATVIEVQQALAGQGVEVLDAPVSGTPDVAARGELLIVAGGPPALVDRCLPVLRSLGHRVVRVGEVGTAKKVKLANNMLGALALLGTLEVLAWADQAGVPREAIYQVLGQTGVCSGNFVRHVQQQAGNPEGYAQKRVTYHKDLRLLLEEAQAAGMPLPVAQQAWQVLDASKDSAGGWQTVASLLAYYQAGR